MDIEKIKSIQPIATKKKRHRRIKAEMELARQQQQQGEPKKKNKKDDYWDSYEHKMITTDEVAEQMIKNAINKHLFYSSSLVYLVVAVVVLQVPFQPLFCDAVSF